MGYERQSNGDRGTEKHLLTKGEQLVGVGVVVFGRGAGCSITCPDVNSIQTLVCPPSVLSC